MCVVFGYLLLTLPSLLSTSHTLYNLEPYPDGLYYVGQGLSLVKGSGFQMSYGEDSLKVASGFLYPLLHIPTFFIFRAPQYFFVTNVLLGVVSLASLFLAVKLKTKSVVLAALAAILLLLHGYFVWLASVPMAENLVISLISLFLLLVVRFGQKKQHASWEILLASILSVSFVVTKFSLVFVSAVVWLTFVVFFVHRKLWRELGVFLLGVCAALACILIYQLGWVGFNPLESVRPQLETKSGVELVTFSFSFVANNSAFYLRSLVGLGTKFLWKSDPITIGLIPLFGILGFWMILRKNEYILGFSQLAIIFVTIAILLPFYAADARYLFGVLPILVFLTVIGVTELSMHSLFVKRKILMQTVIFMVLVVSLCFTQKTLFREIISSNLLHRSKAWQYESVLILDAYFSDHQNATLITVLPPYLYSYHAQNQVVLLPLSRKQEFMNESQRPWGELEYDNLLREYQKILDRNKELYVTNAYLSSQHEFELDWQRIQDRFMVEKVIEGCLNTCNLYKLSTKLSNNR